MARITVDTSGFTGLATQAGNLAASSEAIAKKVKNILNSTDSGTLKRSSAGKDLNGVYSKLLKQKSAMSAFKKECGTSAAAYDNVTKNAQNGIKRIASGANLKITGKLSGSLISGAVTSSSFYDKKILVPAGMIGGGLAAGAAGFIGQQKQPWYGYTPIPPGTVGGGASPDGILKGAHDVVDYAKAGSKLYNKASEYMEYFDSIKLPENRIAGVTKTLSYITDAEKLTKAIRDRDGEAFKQLLEKYGTKAIADAFGKVGGAAALETKAYAKLIWNYAENAGEMIFSGGGTGNIIVDGYQLFFHPVVETGTEAAWDVVTSASTLIGFDYEKWSGYDSPDDALNEMGGYIGGGLNYWGESIKEKGFFQAVGDNVATTAKTWGDMAVGAAKGVGKVAGDVYEGAKDVAGDVGKAVVNSFNTITNGISGWFERK